MGYCAGTVLELLSDIAIKLLYGLCPGRVVYPGTHYTKWQYCIFDRLSSRCGPGSVVGIATGYGLEGSGIESRVGGETLSTCPDRPWGPPSLLYNEYRVFPGGKELPRRDADPSHPSSAVVKKE